MYNGIPEHLKIENILVQAERVGKIAGEKEAKRIEEIISSFPIIPKMEKALFVLLVLFCSSEIILIIWNILVINSNQ